MALDKKMASPSEGDGRWTLDVLTQEHRVEVGDWRGMAVCLMTRALRSRRNDPDYVADEVPFLEANTGIGQTMGEKISKQ